MGVWIGFMVLSLWWLRLNHACTPGWPNTGEILKHQTSLIYQNPSYGKKSDLWQHTDQCFHSKAAAWDCYSCQSGLWLMALREPSAYLLFSLIPSCPFSSSLERNLTYIGEYSSCCPVKDKQESEASTCSARACSISWPFPFDFSFSHEYTLFLLAAVLCNFR